MRFTNSAVKMSETMPEIRCPAPRLGEHNREIYSEILGYSQEEIDNLAAEGVI